jgi:hypothetical protein
MPIYMGFPFPVDPPAGAGVPDPTTRPDPD